MSRILLYRPKKSIKGLFYNFIYCNDVTDITKLCNKNHCIDLLPDIAHRYSLTYKHIIPYIESRYIVRDLVYTGNIYLLRAFTRYSTLNFKYIIHYILCFATDKNIGKFLANFSIKYFDYEFLRTLQHIGANYTIGNFSENLEYLKEKMKNHPAQWEDALSFSSAIGQMREFLEGHISNTPWHDHLENTHPSMLNLNRKAFFTISYQKGINTPDLKQREFLEGFIHKNSSNRFISKLLKTKKVIIYRDKLDETIFGLDSKCPADDYKIKIPFVSDNGDDTIAIIRRSVGRNSLRSAGPLLKSAMIREAHYIVVMAKDITDPYIIDLVLKNI